MKYLKRILLLILTTLILLTVLCPTKVYAASVQVSWISVDESTTTVADNEQENRTFDSVPLFNQGDYTTEKYGRYGTIASHGCGITCVAMVATYFKDEYCSVVDLAERFGHYNTHKGSSWTLFADTAKELDIEFQEQTYSWAKVMQALNNGQVVVSLQGTGRFTNGGHFIVLTGINENGKILVNDPNGYNWTKNEEMIDGFANGFTEEQITDDGGPYWIYGLKNEIKEQETQ